MSTTLAAHATPDAKAPRSWMATTLKRWWVAYITWRIEEAAIAQLWAMSDRELEDIGLTGSAIAGAVRSEVARDPRFQALLLSSPESMLS